MEIQTRNTLRSATTAEHQSSAANEVEASIVPLSPSWIGLADAQKVLKPATQNALHAGLLKPVQTRNPEDNSHLSVEQVIELVDLAGVLKVKVQILRAYVQARASVLSALDVGRLAEHAKMPGDWSPKEKTHHDELLTLWVQLRLEANTLSFSEVLKAADETLYYDTADSNSARLRSKSGPFTG